LGEQVGGIDTAEAASDNYGINGFRGHGNVSLRSLTVQRRARGQPLN